MRKYKISLIYAGFSLAFGQKDMIWSWKVRLLSIFISISSSEELALIHEFCICIDFVSCGFIEKSLLLELTIKPFWWNHLNTLEKQFPRNLEIYLQSFSKYFGVLGKFSNSSIHHKCKEIWYLALENLRTSSWTSSRY